MGVQRTGAWRGVCRVSAPSPRACRWETRRQRRRRVQAMGCGWAGERLGPSSLGGWCAEACNGSCQREHQSIDSR
ncbi:hypothetical protein J3F83DRAFT_747275 [Trichoderma novae-zelandiae]